MAEAQRWRIQGDYFENCNCNVICPCEASPEGFMQARPTQGECHAPVAFHIAEGRYGNVELGDLNVVLMLLTPRPMGQGNATAAAYIDQRATPQQREALGMIFSGQAGGVFGLLAPLVTNPLEPKFVPITFTKEDKSRRVRIPSIMNVGIQALSGPNPEQEMWGENINPFAPKVVIAAGVQGSTYTDHGFNWDNSGKNGHYAPVDLSGP